MNAHAEISVIERTRVPITPSVGTPVIVAKFMELLAAFTLKAKPRAITGFTMQKQCQSNWCWAAVAASVAAYHKPDTLHTQCEIATFQVGNGTDCCQFACHAGNAPGEAGGINVPATLGPCLFYADDHLESSDLTNTNTPVDNLAKLRSIIQTEMEEGRPLCARIVWRNGGAHFMAIVGFDPSTDTLSFADSYFDDLEPLPLRDFPARYQQGGTWHDTYYTKPSKK